MCSIHYKVHHTYFVYIQHFCSIHYCGCIPLICQLLIALCISFQSREQRLWSLWHYWHCNIRSFYILKTTSSNSIVYIHWIIQCFYPHWLCQYLTINVVTSLPDSQVFCIQLINWWSSTYLKQYSINLYITYYGHSLWTFSVR